MRRHKALLTLTMLMRMGGGLASLFLLARALGPGDYGVVATVFAYAAIVTLVTDFGFSVTLLRDVGAEPGRAGAIMAECLRIKNLLSALAALLALAALVAGRPDAAMFWSSVMLFGAVMVLSYGELALTGLRALGRYEVELAVVAAGTAALAMILGGAALAFAHILPMAIAVLLARSIQTGLAFAALAKFVRLGNCLVGPVRRPLRNGAGMAGDTVLTALSGQIDVILVSSLLGFHAAGTYQVAIRAASYVMMPSQVLSGIYTPALSAHHFAADSEARTLEARMRREFPLAGAVLGGFLVAVMPMLAPWIFGHAFTVPLDIWAGLGALVFVRFSTGALGIALVARRAVKTRLLGQGLGVSVLVVGLLSVLPVAGLSAAPWIAVAGAVTTAAIYALALRRVGQETRPAVIPAGE